MSKAIHLVEETALHAATAAILSVITSEYLSRVITYIPRSPLVPTALYSATVAAINLTAFRISDVALDRIEFFRKHFILKYLAIYGIVSAANLGLVGFTKVYPDFFRLSNVEMVIHMTVASCVFRVIVVADAIINKNALSYVIPKQYEKYVPQFLLKPKLAQA